MTSISPKPRVGVIMPGTTVQDYGKEPRAGRKVGHITLIADDEATLHLRLRQVLALVEIE